MTEPQAAPLKIAVCTQSISHFEVPLFRLVAQSPGLRLKVFYIDEVLDADAHNFDANYGQNVHWGGNLLAGYESERCASIRDIRARFDSWGADVALMYGYNWPGAAATVLTRWLRGKPQIHRGTLNWQPNPQARWRNHLLRPLGRWLLARFDAHHFGGNYSRRVLLDAGVSPESLFFVPYSVDSPYFTARANDEDAITAAATLRERAGWRATDRVLLFIAHHGWVKGPDIALEVFRRYRERDASARLLVVGSGAMTGALKRFVQQHGLDDSVHFAGFVASAATVPYYLASDLVLCTSRYETWARMINEAMLCGKPCIVNEFVAAAGDLVRDGSTGYVVRNLEPDAYVDAIARHFSLDADARQRMAESAKEVALEYSYERNMQHVVDAARYAVEKRRR